MALMASKCLILFIVALVALHVTTIQSVQQTLAGNSLTMKNVGLWTFDITFTYCILAKY